MLILPSKQKTHYGTYDVPQATELDVHDPRARGLVFAWVGKNTLNGHYGFYDSTKYQHVGTQIDKQYSHGGGGISRVIGRRTLFSEPPFAPRVKRFPHHHSLNLTNEGTIACWGYFRVVEACYLLGKRDDVIQSYGFFITAGGAFQHYNFPSNMTTDPGVVKLTTYQHFAATWKDGEGHLYVDGESAEVTPTIANATATNSDFFLHARGDGAGGSAFEQNGNLADIFMWNRALTPGEIHSFANPGDYPLRVNKSKTYFQVPAEVPTPTMRVIPYKQKTARDQFNSELDYNDPLTRGLVFAWIGKNLYNDYDGLWDSTRYQRLGYKVEAGTGHGVSRSTVIHRPFTFSFAATPRSFRFPHEPSLNLANEGTIAHWASFRTIEDSYLVCKRDGSTNEYATYCASDGSLRLVSWGSPIDIQSDPGVLIGDNQWRHIVGTWKGTEAHLYIDGVSVEISTLFDPPAVTNAPLYFHARGDGGGGASFYHNGNLGDVFIWNRALTLGEIQSLGDPNTFPMRVRSGERYFTIPAETPQPTPTLRVVPVKKTAPKERPAEFELNTDAPGANQLLEWLAPNIADRGFAVRHHSITGPPVRDPRGGWRDFANNDPIYDAQNTELTDWGLAYKGSAAGRIGTYYYDTSDSEQPANLSISAWVKITSLGAQQRLSNRARYASSSDNEGWYLAITAAGLIDWATFGSAPGSSLTSNGTVPVNRWCHIAVDITGADKRIYIDGNLDSSGTYAPGLIYPGSGQRWSSILGAVTSLPLDGYCADIRIYRNWPLTEDRVRYLYNPETRWDYYLPRSRSYHVVPAEIPTPTLRVIPVKQKLTDRPAQFRLNHNSPQAKGLLHYWSCNEGWLSSPPGAEAFPQAIIDSVSGYHADAPRTIQYQFNQSAIGNPYRGAVYRLNTAFDTNAPTRWEFPNDAFDGACLGAAATFSWSLWVQILDPTQDAASAFILNRFGGAGNRQQILYYRNSSLTWATYSDPDSAGSAKNTSTPIDDQWHLITAVVDVATNIQRLYLDRDLADENSTPFSGMQQVNLPFIFGASAENIAQNRVNARLADVRFYSRALTDADVQAIYDNPWDLHYEPSYLFAGTEAPTPGEILRPDAIDAPATVEGLPTSAIHRFRLNYL